MALRGHIEAQAEHPVQQLCSGKLISLEISALSFQKQNPFHHDQEQHTRTWGIALLEQVPSSDTLVQKMPARTFLATHQQEARKSQDIKSVTVSFATSNKQLNFLQHIYRSLKPDGKARAAVVLPDNVLFSLSGSLMTLLI